MDTKFLKRFTDGTTKSVFPEITHVDDELTNIPWLALPVPRIEPDDWELFWKLWGERKNCTKKYNNIWDSICIWSDPNLTEHQRLTEQPIINDANINDWSNLFPNMFKSIREAMPFETIEKIFIAANNKRVPLHFDPIKKLYPWPNVLRVMLWDTNSKPTFYLSKWSDEMLAMPIISEAKAEANQLYYDYEPPDKDKIYVDLPSNTNTFVYSNGEFLHGADKEKFKIILIVWGIPDVEKWKTRLSELVEHEINKAS